MKVKQLRKLLKKFNSCEIEDIDYSLRKEDKVINIEVDIKHNLTLGEVEVLKMFEEIWSGPCDL